MSKMLEEIITLKDSLSPNFIDALSKRADETLHQIHQDYFEDLSFDDFCQCHLGHTTAVSRALAFRFFTNDIFHQLKSVFETKAHDLYKVGPLSLHPVFYLRFLFPELYKDENYKKAYLDSQPHYDNSFGLYAYTFWVPLTDIDDQTGGLCYFNSDKVKEHFGPWGKNKYNTETYYENAEQLDDLLKGTEVQPYLKRGGALSFEANTLHGATKSKSKWRISFDFRLVEVSVVEKASEVAQRVVQTFADNPELCNAQNLSLLGDYRGAARLYEKLGKDLNDKEYSKLAQEYFQKSPEKQLIDPNTRISWQKEYQWLINNDC